MLRFAMSPTGDMHTSNLRVALFNYILSKQLNEELLIRIDDTEKERNIEGKEKEVLELLSLFSIDYKTAVYQSENLKYHQKMAMQLMAQKNAFACFCSDEKLNELKEKAQNKGKVYSYDGFCSTLSDETVLNCNAPFTVRVQKPADKITFADSLKGNITLKPFEVDSFFILTHDKTPTYNYACAVDDMLHNVSTVLRSDEFLNDSARQIHIRSLLGYDKQLAYIHIPNINDDKSVQCLIDQGFLPSAIANYLVLIGNETPTEIFTLEEAIEWFDIKKVDLSETTFDLNKLKQINKKHLELMDDMRLSKILGFADTDIGKLAKLYLDDCFTINEIKEHITSIFNAKVADEVLKEEFKLIIKALSNAPYFNTLDELKAFLTEKTALNNDSLDNALYFVLTGQHKGPKLSDIYMYIKNYLGEIVK